MTLKMSTTDFQSYLAKKKKVAAGGALMEDVKIKDPQPESTENKGLEPLSGLPAH